MRLNLENIRYVTITAEIIPIITATMAQLAESGEKRKETMQCSMKE